MDRTISKRAASALVGLALALGLAWAAVAPQPAEAAELQSAAALLAQSLGDDIGHPIPIELNKTYYGETKLRGYRDNLTYYTLKAAKGVSYKLSVIATGSYRVQFNVQDEDFNFPWGYNDWKVDAGQGKTEKLALNPGERYYVGIEAEYGSSVHAPYAFTLKATVEKPQVPIVKTVKPGKKKLTVKYYRTQYGDRYQIAIKQAGKKWKTYNNDKKVKKVFSNLKAGKKYKVKVRAQRNFEGKWYSGSWSAVQTVKVKG